MPKQDELLKRKLRRALAKNKEKLCATKAIVEACCTKIRRQYENKPESKLMYAIMRQTIHDAFMPEANGCDPFHSFDSRWWLHKQMYWCEEAGVSSDWVRKVIKDSGLWETSVEAKKVVRDRVKVKHYAGLAA